MPGYSFRLSDGSATLVASDVQKLVEAVLSYKQRNGIATTYQETYNEVTEAISGKVRSKAPEVARRPIEFSDMLRASRAAFKVVSGDTVSQEEINRRAKICANCPMKIKGSGCWGCQASARLSAIGRTMRKLFGKEAKIPHDLKRYGCQCCQCSLGLMVPTKLEYLHEDTEEQKAARPSHCWMLEGSPNYRP